MRPHSASASPIQLLRRRRRPPAPKLSRHRRADRAGTCPLVGARGCSWRCVRRFAFPLSLPFVIPDSMSLPSNACRREAVDARAVPAFAVGLRLGPSSVADHQSIAKPTELGSVGSAQILTTPRLSGIKAPPVVSVTLLFLRRDRRCPRAYLPARLETLYEDIESVLDRFTGRAALNRDPRFIDRSFPFTLEGGPLQRSAESITEATGAHRSASTGRLCTSTA